MLPVALCRRSLARHTAWSRLFSTAVPHLEKQQPPRVVLNEADITENFLRGTGPGGQKINKTSCAVQLLHAPTGITIKCQESRSRTVNRAVARKWLQEKIEEEMLGPESRTQRKKAVESAKKKSKAKKAKRKYRALEEAEGGDQGENEIEGKDEEGAGEPVDMVRQEFEKITRELAEQKNAEMMKKKTKQQFSNANG